MFNKENLKILKETYDEALYELKSEINKIDQLNVNEYLLPTIDILELCNLKLQEMQAKIEYPDDNGVPF
tara:strand:+ start:366 stop:572 length:207 start_codon:yes stop_codon:yes gene_type:complete